ncbi:MAG: coproporphyrinogen dehydrogenase HemZ [Lachnospiraceae bacterium]|nr:coproporphyrinogen dehydrogenase HemZ [Lachnospiraceae bacterium]
MITVCLNKKNFEYDIHSLVKAFYAGEEVKVFADRERICRLEQEETPLFHLEVFYLEMTDLKIADLKTTDLETPDLEISGEQELNWKAPDERESDTGQIEIFLWLPPKELEKGRTFENGGYSVGAQTKVSVDFSDRKETKNRLKQGLYQMLSVYTGQKLPWGTLTGIRPVKIPMAMLEQKKTEEEIKTYMADTYFASDQKIELSLRIAKQEMELLSQIDYRKGYSLYVGIPFCPSICSYCSFSSSPVELWQEKIEDYLTALEQEIDFTAEACRQKNLNTIYIGGGTPTALSAHQLDGLLDKIKNKFNFSHLLEYTLEAGRPDSITKEKLKVLQDHGISRISINPQTMNQKTLNLIGRKHTAVETVESFWLAREMGFDNINMDLILGLPEENLEDVKRTMEQVKKLSPDNLTVHSLAIKRAARLKMYAEEYAGMQMKNSWEMVDLTAEYAENMGMEPYYLYRQKNMAGNFENVGYARPGKAGLYNILIMEEKQTIIACGAGASTKYVLEPDEKGNTQVERTENVKNITQYIERVEEMIQRKREGIEQYIK